MSDMTRLPGDGTPAGHGQTAPDARDETALGTGTGNTASAAAGTRPGTTAGTTAGTAAGQVRGAGETRAADTGTPGGDGSGRLLPGEECDKLAARLQHAVAEFVDRPRDAVEEADHALEEIAARFTEAVTQRRRTLRMSWQSDDAGGGKATAGTDTEQLRLALRDYRQLAERLLRV
ncbi:hypothetical protein AB0K80_00590 [Streptomyces sp. NPDC052682]|uniref:hypothetical protein n=1 Tax=Streptomyces sp. NPDC052682 TaxID=3154954 RepID=UPI00344074AA